ncbi:Swr1 complex bromodomain subunit Bdf1 [Schizosaccharomyces osmophilus]|uniref:Swr1 complex bromodomain subunit Bdf1 n=1 Tax=Schizosaccharomyces osmophilus TaxID=2545709 RepID=A0AAF0AY23_9SCHI|nr:Swr1 complex bromodomain subunit Bdf1 [Schizosaccharomyces osmophilus]WBW74600.1 Swr1 complex bromodomain subunit Bdf1 [Schizosaccharomyces osmophilus]
MSGESHSNDVKSESNEDQFPMETAAVNDENDGLGPSEVPVKTEEQDTDTGSKKRDVSGKQVNEATEPSEEDAMKFEEPSESQSQSQSLTQSQEPVEKRQRGDGMPPPQQKYCAAIVRQLKRTKDSAPFRAPVDPVKQNIPDYPTIVKQPMDLGTIEKKTSNRIYSSPQEFIDDMNLMFSNCFLYNGTNSPVGSMGKSLQTVFERQLKQLPDSDQAPAPVSKKTKQKPSPAPVAVATAPTPAASTRTRRSSSVSSLSRPSISSAPPSAVPSATSPPLVEGKPKRRKNNSQMRYCTTILKEIYKRQYEPFVFPFYQPVDPVACDCPDYFEVVKYPMDLSTVQAKLSKNEYEVPDEFESDIRLMLDNCFTYNPPGTPVHLMGRQLEDLFNEKWNARPKYDDVTLNKQQAVETASLLYENGDEEAFLSEEEVNGDKFAAVDKQISMLQDTLEAMKAKKMKRMRKPRRRDSNKEYGPITYAMQTELAERCNYLTAEQLSTVAEILREEMPWLRDTDEIEIDVGNMKPETFHRIYRFVCKPEATSSDPPSPSLMPSRHEKKKGRVLSETEQADKIRRLQQQLDRFAGKASDAPLGQSHEYDRTSESAESDNESESSESE